MKRIWRRSAKADSSSVVKTNKDTSLSSHIPFFKQNKSSGTPSSSPVLHPNIRECGQILDPNPLQRSAETVLPNIPTSPTPVHLPKPQIPTESHDPPKDKIEAIKAYFWEMHVRWTTIVYHPTAVLLWEAIFLQPAYLCFFAVLTTYILGSFRFSYFWCLFIALFVNYVASKILSRITSSTIRKERLHGTSHRTEMYPDKESAVWVNNMIIGVISNHHTYISKIVLRFLNPMFDRFLAIPPVEYIKFEDMDIGTNPPRISNCSVTLDEHTPPKSLKYDFDVELATNMKGSMKLSLAILPEIPLVVSDLMFKSRMRIAVSFYPQKFPFISNCKISVLEEPDIDISVEMAGLPDFLILPFVTDHYLKVIRRFLYQQIGAPNYLEIDLSVLIQDHGDAGECLVEDVQAIIPGIIRHGNVPVDTPDLTKKPRGSKIARAVYKIKNTPLMSTPKRYDAASLMKGNTRSVSASSEVLLSEREIINSSGILGAALGAKRKPVPSITVSSDIVSRPIKDLSESPKSSPSPIVRRFKKHYPVAPHLSDNSACRKSSLRKETKRSHFKRSSSSLDEASLQLIINSSRDSSPSTSLSSGNLSD